MREIRDWAGEPGRPDVYTQRRERLRHIIREKGVDCLLVLRAPNRFYLSGFELHDSQPGESAGCILVGSDGEDWLATDARYEVAAKRIWAPERVFIYGGDIIKDLKTLLRRRSCIAGVESKGASYHFLAALMPQKYTDTRIVWLDGLVEKLRVIKDDLEIGALRKSFNLNHRLLQWLVSSRLSDMGEISEQELAWEIESYFRTNGAQELAFKSIVASGCNAALPHALPENIPIAHNLPLLVDIGCRVANYCSDQTRTYWIGNKPSAEFEQTLRLVKEAQARAIEAIHPGASCADIYWIARKVFEKAGVEQHFNHGLGHGVGLETHEAPSLSPRSKTVLEKHMVVTVEPGLYYPAWGGIRWEHTILVGEKGAEIL